MGKCHYIDIQDGLGQLLVEANMNTVTLPTVGKLGLPLVNFQQRHKQN